MVMVKAISVTRGILLVGSQLVGAIFASFIVSVLFPTTFNVRTTLSADTSVARGVFVSLNSSSPPFRLLIVSADRSNPYSRTSFCHLHAGQREAQSHVYGSHWYWSRFVHCRDGRSVLHRWQFEPCTFFWTLCHLWSLGQ